MSGSLNPSWSHCLQKAWDKIWINLVTPSLASRRCMIDSRCGRFLWVRSYADWPMASTCPARLFPRHKESPVSNDSWAFLEAEDSHIRRSWNSMFLPRLISRKCDDLGVPSLRKHPVYISRAVYEIDTLVDISARHQDSSRSTRLMLFRKQAATWGLVVVFLWGTHLFWMKKGGCFTIFSWIHVPRWISLADLAAILSNARFHVDFVSSISLLPAIPQGWRTACHPDRYGSVWTHILKPVECIMGRLPASELWPHTGLWAVHILSSVLKIGQPKLWELKLETDENSRTDVQALQFWDRSPKASYSSPKFKERFVQPWPATVGQISKK